MAMNGLFNKVKNRPTRRKFVVSTIRKDECVFETAVFETNFFYLPRRWSQPDLSVTTSSSDEAWDLHYRLAARLAKEYPGHLIKEYLETAAAPLPQD